MKHFMKEIFGFHQKKPPHASLVLLFQLHNKEEVICRNEKICTVVNCKNQFMMK